MQNPNTRALGGLLFLLVVMAALLFIPAGTLDYRRAWVFLAVFGGSALTITLYLMKADPGLLARRVRAGPTAEKETPSADHTIDRSYRVYRDARRARTR